MRRKGLLQTTSRDVAAEAGTSSGLLAHYFESHDHLLVCAFEQVAERDLARMRALLQAEPDVVARLRVLLEEFSPAEHAWQYRVWIDVWGAAAQSEALRRSSRRLNLRWVALVTEVFRTGAGDGSFRTAQPDASAWRLLALMDGLSVQLVAGSDRRGPGRPARLGARGRGGRGRDRGPGADAPPGDRAPGGGSCRRAVPGLT
jgi:AcrR family transcriptional regulator